MSNTNLYIIETTDDRLLGTIEFVEGGITVRNGFVGRPQFVAGEDLVNLFIIDEEEDLAEPTAAEDDYIKVG